MPSPLRSVRPRPGWTASVTGRNHIKLTHEASGRVVFTSGTSSDVRAWRNVLTNQRRIEREYEASLTS